MKQLRVKKTTQVVDSSDYGKWQTANDHFPTIDVNQKTGTVKVTFFETSGFQDIATVDTGNVTVKTKRNSSFIRGEVEVKNYSHWQASKTQKFCFAIFQGDSGHIYTHRAPATKGWMNEKPENIRKRLRKLGIGIEKAVQQGDFLLKPANGNALSDDQFKHETMGAGHHKFECPVLYATGKSGRQYKITEPTQLIHEAVDGIQHPAITVKPGIYIVGTTANSLNHSNIRD